MALTSISQIVLAILPMIMISAQMPDGNNFGNTLGGQPYGQPLPQNGLQQNYGRSQPYDPQMHSNQHYANTPGQPIPYSSGNAGQPRVPGQPQEPGHSGENELGGGM